MRQTNDDPSPKPAPGGVGLIITDMINDLDYPGSEKLVAAALPMAERILDLRGQADALGLPVIYVNDNFGHWHSERSRIIDHCRRAGAPAAKIVERLGPRDGDFFVIKPQFSGFCATNLQVLLPRLGVHRLVIAGMAADICVLFTAADAHMRDYGLWVPCDAVAADDPERAAWALEIMKKEHGRLHGRQPKQVSGRLGVRNVLSSPRSPGDQITSRIRPNALASWASRYQLSGARRRTSSMVTAEPRTRFSKPSF
jgi:nicotinamidase-related amidase